MTATGAAISVCMPIYNSSKYIAPAIESVLTQSRRDFELVIMDDCSTDDTGTIAASYAEKDARIRFIKHETNVGMVNNWNLCLENARGRYIKYLFGDDLLAADALERMAADLDADPSVSMVASARVLIDEEHRPLKTLSHFDSRTYEGTEIIRVCFMNQNNLVGEPTAVMFRKELAGRGFNTGYRQMVDLEMWFHLLDQGALAYHQHPLCSFRKHSEQQTGKNNNNLLHYSEFFVLMEKYIDKPYLNFNRIDREMFLFEKYYSFWKKYHRQEQFRHIAEEIINRQFGKERFYGMMVLYKLYNPFRKLYSALCRCDTNGTGGSHR